MNAQAEQNRYAPPEAEVSDYVDENATAEPASRGKRLGAASVDGLIGLLLFLPILIGIGFNMEALIDSATYTGSSVAVIITILGFIAWAVVTFVLVKRNGQTIGKKMVGIKVVRSDGSNASLGRIFWLRNVVNAIPSMIPLVGSLYGLVDHLFIFAEKRQCLHDKIADTIVVNA